jgi:hypothetical protein
VCRSQYRARETTSPAESFAVLCNGKTNIIVFLPTIQYTRTTNIFENKPLWNGSFFQKLVGLQLLSKLQYIFKHTVSLPVSSKLLPQSAFLPGLFFNLQDGGDIFLRNFVWLSTGYME